MEKELRLMKGNEAVAEAAIRAGADGYFGYPITPQSEILEYLMEANPYTTTGMVVLQAESEVAAINMVYGGAACGKKVLTTSSSPGISLKQEGITYIAGAELPCLIVNVVRGGPGLGTIQPAQSDYFQATKDMVTTILLYLPLLRCRRWQTLWSLVLIWHSNTAIRL
jgi:2-oxoglutarate ferredoxin oxidoreductase subunit alpha